MDVLRGALVSERDARMSLGLSARADRRRVARAATDDPRPEPARRAARAGRGHRRRPGAAPAGLRPRRAQQIEHDCVEIVAGVRHGQTMGGPIAMVVKNRDWANWQGRMDIAPVPEPPPPVTRLRPGPCRPGGRGQVRPRRRAQRARARQRARDGLARRGRRRWPRCSCASSGSRSAATCAVDRPRAASVAGGPRRARDAASARRGGTRSKSRRCARGDAAVRRRRRSS